MNYPKSFTLFVLQLLCIIASSVAFLTHPNESYGCGGGYSQGSYHSYSQGSYGGGGGCGGGYSQGSYSSYSQGSYGGGGCGGGYSQGSYSSYSQGSYGGGGCGGGYSQGSYSGGSYSQSSYASGGCGGSYSQSNYCGGLCSAAKAVAAATNPVSLFQSAKTFVTAAITRAKETLGITTPPVKTYVDLSYLPIPNQKPTTIPQNVVPTAKPPEKVNVPDYIQRQIDAQQVTATKPGTPLTEAQQRVLEIARQAGLDTTNPAAEAAALLGAKGKTPDEFRAALDGIKRSNPNGDLNQAAKMLGLGISSPTNSGVIAQELRSLAGLPNAGDYSNALTSQMTAVDGAKGYSQSSYGCGGSYSQSSYAATPATDYSTWKGLGDENGQKYGQSYSGPKGATQLNDAARYAAVKYAGYAVPNVPATAKEIDMMTRMMLAESPIKNKMGGLNTDGLVKVADVIRNRVLSSDYPNSVAGVISQKSQFEPYKSTTNNYMDPRYGPTNPNYTAAQSIAKSVLDGTSVPSAVTKKGTGQLNYSNVPAVVKYGEIGKATQKTVDSNLKMKADPDSVTIKDAKKPGIQHTFGTIGNADAPNFTPKGGVPPTPKSSQPTDPPTKTVTPPQKQQTLKEIVAPKPTDTGVTKFVKTVVQASPTLRGIVEGVSWLQEHLGGGGTTGYSQGSYGGNGSDKGSQNASSTANSHRAVSSAQAIDVSNQTPRQNAQAALSLLAGDSKNGVTVQVSGFTTSEEDANVLRRAYFTANETKYTLEYKKSIIPDSNYFVLKSIPIVPGASVEFSFSDVHVDGIFDSFSANGIVITDPALTNMLQQKYVKELKNVATKYYQSI